MPELTASSNESDALLKAAKRYDLTLTTMKYT